MNPKPQMRAYADEIAPTILKRMEEKSLSARQVSLAASGHDGMIRDLKSGRVPTADRLAKLLSVLDLELAIVDRGAVAKLTGPISQAEDFSMIPRYEVRASAGTGLAVLSEEVLESLAFKTDWLRRIGVEPSRAGLVQAHGDSMTPTITDGALMLLDMRDDQLIRHGCVYVILRDGDLIVKRVDRSADDGSIALISDNKRYRKQVVTVDQLAEMRIPGRVVWVGNAI